MTVKLPYVKWRNGRPRFHPSAPLMLGLPNFDRDVTAVISTYANNR